MDHVVLFKWNEGVTEERIAELGKALEALVDKIDAVESIRFGPSVTDRHKGFTHGLVVRLSVSTAEDLSSEYSKHPAHEHVLKMFITGDGDKIKGMVADAMATDVARPPVVQSKPEWVSIAACIGALGVAFAAGYALARTRS